MAPARLIAVQLVNRQTQTTRTLYLRPEAVLALEAYTERWTILRTSFRPEPLLVLGSVQELAARLGVRLEGNDATGG